MGCGASSPVSSISEELPSLPRLEVTAAFLEVLCGLSVQNADSSWIQLGDMTTQQVVSTFVRPLTQKSTVSFCEGVQSKALDWSATELRDRNGELLQDVKSTPNEGMQFPRLQLLVTELMSCMRPGNDRRPIPVFYVSHPWNTKFKDLFAMMRDHTSRQPGRVAYYWLDVFAHNLHSPKDFSSGASLILNNVKSVSAVVLVMHPWEKPVSMSRTWCLYEAWVAKQNNVPVHFALHPTTWKDVDAQQLENNFKQCLVEFAASSSQTSRKEDQEHLLRLMTAGSDIKALNTHLSDILTSACKLLKVQVSSEIEPSLSEVNTKRIVVGQQGGFAAANGANYHAPEEPPTSIPSHAAQPVTPKAPASPVSQRPNSLVADDGKSAKALAFGLLDSRCAVKELSMAYSEQDCIAAKGEIMEVFSALKLNATVVDLSVSMPLLQLEPVVALISILASNRTLRSVTLSSWLDEDRVQRLTAAMAANVSIHRVRLRVNSMTPACAPHVAGLLTSTAGRTYLQDLEIMQHDFGDEGTAALTPALTINRSLISFHLYTGSMSAGAMQALVGAFKGATKLRSLSFDSEGLRNSWLGEPTLAVLMHALAETGASLIAPALLSLDLGHCGLEAGGQALGVLATLLASNARKSLLRLRLRGNTKLGDIGIAALAAALEGNTHIEELDLANCGVGNDGVTALCAAMKSNTSLKRLLLDDNVDVTDYDIKSVLLPTLGTNRVVKVIRLTGTKVTAAVQQQVETALAQRH